MFPEVECEEILEVKDKESREKWNRVLNFHKADIDYIFDYFEMLYNYEINQMMKND